jgi:hypothetical protein
MLTHVSFKPVINFTQKSPAFKAKEEKEPPKSFSDPGPNGGIRDPWSKSDPDPRGEYEWWRGQPDAAGQAKPAGTSQDTAGVLAGDSMPYGNNSGIRHPFPTDDPASDLAKDLRKANADQTGVASPAGGSGQPDDPAKKLGGLDDDLLSWNPDDFFCDPPAQNDLYDNDKRNWVEGVIEKVKGAKPNKRNMNVDKGHSP